MAKRRTAAPVVRLRRDADRNLARRMTIADVGRQLGIVAAAFADHVVLMVALVAAAKGLTTAGRWLGRRRRNWGRSTAAGPRPSGSAAAARRRWSPWC